METKKNPKATLENKRVLFLEVGLIFALTALIGVFSYSVQERKAPTLQASLDEIPEQEITPITMELPPEPPKFAPIPVFSEVLQIVEDEVECDDIISLDDNQFEVPLTIYTDTVDEANVVEEDIPFVLVEEKPRFQGGNANDFSRWISQHLEYPEIAKENAIKGRVILQFTIRKDGTLGDIKLLRGVDPVLDKEAMRVVGTSPRWEPGRQRDRAVNVTYQFPVIFELR